VEFSTPLQANWVKSKSKAGKKEKQQACGSLFEMQWEVNRHRESGSLFPKAHWLLFGEWVLRAFWRLFMYMRQMLVVQSGVSSGDKGCYAHP
jgi:hypothetical protein